MTAGEIGLHTPVIEKWMAGHRKILREHLHLVAKYRDQLED